MNADLTGAHSCKYNLCQAYSISKNLCLNYHIMIIIKKNLKPGYCASKIVLQSTENVILQKMYLKCVNFICV